MWTKTAPSNEGYLAHYGIRGQKWGVRNYQHEDGSLTPAGVERYRDKSSGRRTGSLRRRGDGLGTGPVGDGQRPSNVQASNARAAAKSRAAKKMEQNTKDKIKELATGAPSRSGGSSYGYGKDEDGTSWFDNGNGLKVMNSEGNGFTPKGRIYVKWGNEYRIKSANGPTYSVPVNDPLLVSCHTPDDYARQMDQIYEREKAIDRITGRNEKKDQEDTTPAPEPKTDNAKKAIGKVLSSENASKLVLKPSSKDESKSSFVKKVANKIDSAVKKISSTVSNLFKRLKHDDEYTLYIKHSSEEDAIRTNWVRASEDSLMHYQVKGAKHGLRRYQNPDGTLTPLGRIHYGVGDPRARRHQEREYERAERASEKAARKERVTLAKEGVAAGKARAKWESMSDEDKLKVYDKNLKKSRDLRYKKSKEAEKAKEEAEKANTKAKEAEAQKEDSKKDEPEKQLSKREQKQEQKKAAEREEQIKKDTEKIKEAIKTESQNEPAQKERKPLSAADYKDTASMLQTTSANLSSMKDLVNVIEGARQRNAVRNAVGERKLSKPISEMSDKEINDIVNRWALEDRIASASVGAKSKAAENVTTALDVVGNLTLQSSRAFSIASNIRSIVERR